MDVKAAEQILLVIYCMRVRVCTSRPFYYTQRGLLVYQLNINILPRLRCGSGLRIGLRQEKATGLRNIFVVYVEVKSPSGGRRLVVLVQRWGEGGVDSLLEWWHHLVWSAGAKAQFHDWNSSEAHLLIHKPLIFMGGAGFKVCHFLIAGLGLLGTICFVFGRSEMHHIFCVPNEEEE